MNKNFTSGASSVTVQYSVTGNCQDKVSFTKEGDFISTSQTSSSITISVSENRGEARSGHVYTYYNNTLCNNNTITITQTAGPCTTANVTYHYNDYIGDVNACDTSKTVTVSGVNTTTYTDPSCGQETEEQVTTDVTLNFDKNTSSDGRTIQSGFTRNGSKFTVLLYQYGGCEEPEPGGDYADQYLTIESLSDNNIIYFKSSGNILTKIISASTDNGRTWTEYASSYLNNGTPIATLNSNEKVLLKGDNDTYAFLESNNDRWSFFTASREFNIYGNIMSLINSESFTSLKEFEKQYVFRRLFFRCTALKSAENLILPATTLRYGCYLEMFYGCTNLTTAPELPATTIAGGCYNAMFADCSNLTSAPSLPATTLGNDCYAKMFSGCTRLTIGPSELPAETATSKCYYQMFFDCTSLTTAPVLSATTLASECYQEMFRKCTSLTTAPELPATTLTYRCYDSMFHGCTNLNYIECLATDINAENCTQNWVGNISSGGRFVKSSGITEEAWGRGPSGIPTGWNVENAS